MLPLARTPRESFISFVTGAAVAVWQKRPRVEIPNESQQLLPKQVKTHGKWASYFSEVRKVLL